MAEGVPEGIGSEWAVGGDKGGDNMGGGGGVTKLVCCRRMEGDDEVGESREGGDGVWEGEEAKGNISSLKTTCLEM